MSATETERVRIERIRQQLNAAPVGTLISKIGPSGVRNLFIREHYQGTIVWLGLTKETLMKPYRRHTDDLLYALSEQGASIEVPHWAALPEGQED